MSLYINLTINKITILRSNEVRNGNRKGFSSSNEPAR